MASVITPDRFESPAPGVSHTDAAAARSRKKTRSAGLPVDSLTVFALVVGLAGAVGLFLVTRVFYSGEFLLPAIAGTAALVFPGTAVLSGSRRIALIYVALGATAFAAALAGRGGSMDLVALSFLIHGVAGALHALPSLGAGESPRLFGAWSVFGTVLALLLIVTGP